MKIPKSAPEAVARFDALRPQKPNVAVRKMFGQPAAFVNGNLFFGVYGDEVFVRLAETDRAELGKVAGAHPLEPMPGRPMSEYVVLPPSVLGDPKRASGWVERSLKFAGKLAPKAKRA
ncbi:MAG TPA: TfoX/Sxy family protein [Thermoplasmata archaeon]|nr:TfoX/Sxy family protein [Thermoplasmata archaeon]